MAKFYKFVESETLNERVIEQDSILRAVEDFVKDIEGYILYRFYWDSIAERGVLDSSEAVDFKWEVSACDAVPKDVVSDEIE